MGGHINTEFSEILAGGINYYVNISKYVVIFVLICICTYMYIQYICTCMY